MLLRLAVIRHSHIAYLLVQNNKTDIWYHVI